jgi:membrane carboxypeptidase/penicillin-binding protein
MWYLLRWQGYYYGKKKRDSKFTITLDFKLESHREGSATYFREYLRDYMKNGLMKTRSPTDLIMTSTKMDTTIDSRMQLHAEEGLLTWQIFRKIFYSGKRIKRSICRHLRQRNAAHFDQCNESIKPMVCFKISRKAMKRL